MEEHKRKENLMNIKLIEQLVLSDYYEIPIIRKETVIPQRIIPFSQIFTVRNIDCGVHFFIDDYRFERIWKFPNRYLSRLKKFNCIFAPDFSVYWDMPFPMKIWNIYRSRFIGQWLQKEGVRVVPSITWAEDDTFEYCFQGVEKGSTVAISTVGSRRNQSSLRIWVRGVDEMIRRISPGTILIYGDPINYDFGDINVVYYPNDIIERRKTYGR